MSPPFLPGLELSRTFYEQAVRPIVRGVFPQLRYSAARIGSGSEVLGFDTERSADHEWGPRLELFVSDDDLLVVGEQLPAVLSERLPRTHLGWSTHFGPADEAIHRMEPADGPVRHRVGVNSLGAWSHERLGFDARREVTDLDWLATSGQRLAEVVGGAVFHDGLAELGLLRQRLRWYPDDVWRFVLAGQWQRIAQEEAFPGRCAEVGDELGCRVETSRLVRDLMRLCLLMEKRYVLYNKWLGSAFDRLRSAPSVGPWLRDALVEPTWPEREESLARAYVVLAEQHNRLELTPPLETSTRYYYERPFLVIGADRFVAALRAGISDPHLHDLPPVGGVDQWVDNTDVLTDPRRARAVAAALLS
jgi:uncharacterized protein DUF4037